MPNLFRRFTTLSRSTNPGDRRCDPGPILVGRGIAAVARSAGSRGAQATCHGSSRRRGQYGGKPRDTRRHAAPGRFGGKRSGSRGTPGGASGLWRRGGLSDLRNRASHHHQDPGDRFPPADRARGRGRRRPHARRRRRAYAGDDRQMPGADQRGGGVRLCQGFPDAVPAELCDCRRRKPPASAFSSIPRAPTTLAIRAAS